MNTQEKLRQKRLEQENKIKERKEAEQKRLEEKRKQLEKETRERDNIKFKSPEERVEEIKDTVTQSAEKVKTEATNVKDKLEEISEDIKEVFREYEKPSYDDFAKPLSRRPVHFTYTNFDDVNSDFAKITLYDKHYHELDTSHINEFIKEKAQRIKDKTHDIGRDVNVEFSTNSGDIINLSITTIGLGIFTYIGFKLVDLSSAAMGDMNTQGNIINTTSGPAMDSIAGYITSPFGLMFLLLPFFMWFMMKAFMSTGKEF